MLNNVGSGNFVMHVYEFASKYKIEISRVESNLSW